MCLHGGHSSHLELECDRAWLNILNCRRANTHNTKRLETVVPEVAIISCGSLALITIQTSYLELGRLLSKLWRGAREILRSLHNAHASRLGLNLDCFVFWFERGGEGLELGEGAEIWHSEAVSVRRRSQLLLFVSWLRP